MASTETAALHDSSTPKGFRHVPREPGRTVYAVRTVLQLSVRAFLRTYNRLQVHGREHLPLGQSFVMVCNHASHFDALCLMSSLPIGRIHHTFPAAAADYFFSSAIRSAISVVLFNGLPFDRESRSAESLEMCRALLASPGNILILFPEGTRSATGRVARFRSGVARLVAGTDTPVVPCHLSGGYEAWPREQLLPRPRALRLHIGRPRVFAAVPPHDAEALAVVCATLRDDVVRLATATPDRADRLQMRSTSAV